VPSLIDTLAGLVETPGEIRDVAKLAGVPLLHAIVDGSPHSVWMSVLRHAAKCGKLDTIIDLVGEWFPPSQSKLAEQKSLYVRSVASPDDQPARDRSGVLRSRRPARELPSDYSSICFDNRFAAHGTPEPIADIIGAFKPIETIGACCLVAHYGDDVEFSLLELEEAIILSEPGKAERPNSIWIRGDALWISPYQSQLALPGRSDGLLLRQIRQPGIDEHDFEFEFEALLDGPDQLFVIDFSRLPTSSIGLAADAAQIAHRDAVVRGVSAFFANVQGRGHKIAVGLPRCALGLPAWNDFVLSVAHSFFASDLFGSGPTPSGDRLENLGRLVTEAIEPLMRSNSHALRSRLQAEIEALAASRVKSGSDQQQMRDVLAIAGRLGAAGFLDPAYRLEQWYRGKLTPPMKYQVGADLRASSDGAQTAYGQIENVCDLPAVAGRALVTGNSGFGKPAILRQMEAKWCLPTRGGRRRSSEAWLPIFMEILEDPAHDLRQHFSRRSTITNDGSTVSLNAAAELARIVTPDNFVWLFSSPILLLIGDLRDADKVSPTATWIRCFLEQRHLRSGFMVAYNDIAAAPLAENWFKNAFASHIEARLRPLDRAGATALCGEPAIAKEVERLFASPDDPLSSHVGNPYVVECICAAAQHGVDLRGMGTFQLIEHAMYLRSVGESDRVREAIDLEIPALAFTLFAGLPLNASGEANTAGVRLDLLLPGEQPRFKHRLVADYFVGVYLRGNWPTARAILFDCLRHTHPALWKTTYAGTLHMAVQALHARERDEIGIFLSEAGQSELAHRCFLGLPSSAYNVTTVAGKIRGDLVEAVAADLCDGSRQAYERRRSIADALGRFDPRIPSMELGGDDLIKLASSDQCDLFIGRFPVTNLEFSRFVDRGGYSDTRYWQPVAWEWIRTSGTNGPAYWNALESCRPNHPVVGVSFHEALAYCRWLNEQAASGMKYALPTMSQWALAAGTAELLAGLWDGSRSANDIVSSSRSAILSLTKQQARPLEVPGGMPIGLFPPSRAGVYDLFGNVWQWCDDWFSGTNASEPPSGQHTLFKAPVMVCGGPTGNPTRAVASLLGGGLDPFSRTDNVGFRMVARQLMLDFGHQEATRP
jgi:hypothetical protein